jgi:hypothetical protein
VTVPDFGVDVLPLPEFEVPPFEFPLDEFPPLQALRQVKLNVTRHRIQSEYRRRSLNRTKNKENVNAAMGVYRTGDAG